MNQHKPIGVPLTLGGFFSFLRRPAAAVLGNPAHARSQASGVLEGAWGPPPPGVQRRLEGFSGKAAAGRSGGEVKGLRKSGWIRAMDLAGLLVVLAALALWLSKVMDSPPVPKAPAMPVSGAAVQAGG